MSKKRFKVLDELLKEAMENEGLLDENGFVHGYKVGKFVIGDIIEADENAITPEFWANEKLFEVIENE